MNITYYITGKRIKMRWLLTLLFATVSIMAFAQHSFVIDAPRVVEQNEFFNVVYTANSDISKFNQPSFTGLEVLAGPTLSRMSSTQIINGKRSDTYTTSYTYVLRAKSSSGKARISSASAVIDGRTYNVSGVDVDIVANSSGSTRQSSGSQSSGDNEMAEGGVSRASGKLNPNDIFLSLNFSKTKVVKGEPIIATLKLYTRVPITGFEDIKFPVFNGFWSQEIETPQNINFGREKFGNQIYDAAVLRKYLLFPQQSGNIKIDPAEMICQIQLRSSGGGSRSMFDDFFDSYQTVKKRIYSKSTNIYVTPLPGGAPATFGGAVGKFSMSAKLSREGVKAHEAASLIVEITGKGNLNLIEAPKVELPADFEKYDVKTDNNLSNGASGISGVKRFEYPFIPRSEGTFEIPAIVYSYYDINSGKYVTIQSTPLKLKVEKGDPNSVNGNLVSGINKQDVVNLESDIRYIEIGAPHLVRSGSLLFGGLFFFIIIAVLFLLFFIVYKLLLARAKLRGDVRRVKKRKANKVAKMRLKQAQSYMNENLPSPFYEEIHKALLGYISDKLSIQFADMQRETIKETLTGKRMESSNIDLFMTLLDDCEMARYSQESGGESMDVMYNRAMEVISEFENRL